MKISGTILFFFTVLICSAQHRAGKSLISDEEIQSEAIQQYLYFLSANKVLDTATDKNARTVHRVALNVFNAAKNYYTQKKKMGELQNFIWEIQLVDKKLINAFCLPGARMIVGTGMFDWAQNDGSLAVALAHELAHTLYRDGERRLRTALQEKMGGKRFSELMGSARASDTRDIFLSAFGAGSSVALLPPYTPEDEIRADQLAMIIMGLAGYNQREYLVFWERMDRWSRGPRQPVLLSIHPYTPDRISAMRDMVDEMVKAWYRPPGKS